MRNNLKKARQSKNMTQQEVADYLNITKRHYQFIESGDRIGAIDLWDRLEDLFTIHQRELRRLDQVNSL